jgi:hypothetical protein
MASSAAKTKVASTADEILADVKKSKGKTATAIKIAPATADPRFADIASNPFYQVLFNPKLSAKEKSKQFAVLMAYTGSKEESREHVAAQELFKEYLQSVRETMATEIIQLTDTDTFAELKDTYGQMNQGLIDFENQMGPLTDIIDAVYKLRTSGMTLEAFRGIIEDKRLEDQRRKDLDDIKTQVTSINNAATETQRNIAALKTKRGLFGLGGLPQNVKEDIARQEADLAARNEDLAKLQSKAVELEAEVAPQVDEDPEFAVQKQKLRELLDISSDEHKDRQKGLVNAALDFVQTSKTRVGSIRDHLGMMNGQIEGLADANDSMSTVYAIMQDGLKEADKLNRTILAQFDKPTADEDAVAKMTRETNKLAVDQHIKAVDTSTVDTMATYADLTTQAIRIKGMRDNNTDNLNTAKILHSQGVAGVADRLSTVLQAVSMAALGESSAMARNTMERMRSSTNAVTQKEAIRQAMGVTDSSDALSKVIDDLAGYGQVINTATDITKEGLATMRTKMEELEKLASEVRSDTQKAYAVNSDTLTKTASPKATAAPKSNDPFAKLIHQ